MPYPEDDMQVFLDIETFSDVDLPKANAYVYTESPLFEILITRFAVGDGPVEEVLGTQESVAWFRSMWDAGATFIAHNAAFERVCFSVFDPTWSDPSRWVCTAAMAANWGYPRSLENAGAALDLPVQKDKLGAVLMRRFSMLQPKNRAKRRIFPWEDPEGLARYSEYCRVDVEVCRSIYHRLGRYSTPVERRMWELDQRINDRGLTVDTELATLAVSRHEDNKRKIVAGLKEKTGLANPNSVVQLTGWLQSRGLDLPDLQKETVEDVLTRPGLDSAAADVLRDRLLLSNAAVSKFNAALRCTSDDGRLRGAFHYFGAHTGRFAGRGVQLQNLPRKTVDDVEQVKRDLAEGRDVSSDVLRKSLRPMLVGPFTIFDYSAIESRVLSWLAGEEWALDAFRKGRDLYVETAFKMGLFPEGVTDPYALKDEEPATFDAARSKGKIAVLALGYGGGVGALRKFGAEGTDEELDDFKNGWRAANKAAVKLWYSLEDGMRDFGRVNRHLRVRRTKGGDRAIVLPSGRPIVYRGSAVDPFVYMDPVNRAPKDLYGGRLCENVVQAVARDLLVEAMLRLEDAGLRILGHVHDEVIVEGEQDQDLVRDLMCELPSWAEGLPIDAKGGVAPRYSK